MQFIARSSYFREKLHDRLDLYFAVQDGERCRWDGLALAKRIVRRSRHSCHRDRTLGDGGRRLRRLAVPLGIIRRCRSRFAARSRRWCGCSGPRRLGAAGRGRGRHTGRGAWRRRRGGQRSARMHPVGTHCFGRRVDSFVRTGGAELHGHLERDVTRCALHGDAHRVRRLLGRGERHRGGFGRGVLADCARTPESDGD